MSGRPTVKRSSKFEVFRGRDGRGYWHARASNGRIVEQSQGYVRVRDARRAARNRAKREGGKVVDR